MPHILDFFSVKRKQKSNWFFRLSALFIAIALTLSVFIALKIDSFALTPVFPSNTTGSTRTFTTIDPTIFSTGSVNTDVTKTATVYNMSLPESRISGGQYITVLLIVIIN